MFARINIDFINVTPKTNIIGIQPPSLLPSVSEVVTPDMSRSVTENIMDSLKNMPTKKCLF